MKKKPSSNKGISRIDSTSTHGWFVRGYRNNKTFSKLFSDKKLGGKAKALIAAKAFRQSLWNKIEKIPVKRRPRRLVVRDSRNTTGVIGVCHIAKKNNNGSIYESYAVSWRPKPGIQKCTSFSIKKYGRQQAFRLAVELRKKMLKRIYGAEVFSKMKQLQKKAA